MNEFSFGEIMLGLDKPSEAGVAAVKGQFVPTLNLLHNELIGLEEDDIKRSLVLEAINHTITSAMWTVKAMTFGK